MGELVRDTESSNHDCSDIAAVERGEQEAFSRLYDRHAPVVLAICRGRIGSLAEGEDALQETFIRAFDLLGKLDSCRKFRPWLFGIARNVCLEAIRSRRRRTMHEGESMISTKPQHQGSGHAVQQQEELDRLSQALLKLPEDQRLAIHLYYMEDNHVEVARQVIGVSRSNFYKLLAQARESLQEYMNEGTGR